MMENESKLIIPLSIVGNLPSMVKSELSKLSPQKQEEFVEEYKRKEKSVGIAYVLWIFFCVYYAYLGKWGMQVLVLLTCGLGGILLFVDLFRIPKMVKDYNRDMATDVLRNMKAISEHR